MIQIMLNLAKLDLNQDPFDRDRNISVKHDPPPKRVSQYAGFNVLPGLNGIVSKMPGDAYSPKFKKLKLVKIFKVSTTLWLHQRPHT